MLICRASEQDTPKSNFLALLGDSYKHCVFQCDKCDTVLDIYHMLENECYLCISCTSRVIKACWSDGKFACKLQFDNQGEVTILDEKPAYRPGYGYRSPFGRRH